MFESSGYSKHTRVAADGKVKNPMPEYENLVSNGIEVWNVCPELRAASTRQGAKQAAHAFARGVPL
jgi:hypothetical protein